MNMKVQKTVTSPLLRPHLLLLLLLVLQQPHRVYSTHMTRWSHVQTSRNLTFQDHLLWAFTIKSKLRCAGECAKQDNCHAFTITKVTSDSMMCRAHTQAMTSGGVATENTMLYHLIKDEVSSTPTTYYLGSTWLTRACSEQSECIKEKAECFRGRCLCTPGYFFSEGQDSCQANCSDLQRDFVPYPKWYIAFHNLDEAQITLRQCGRWCVSVPHCVTMEYNYDASKCYIARVTVLDKPSSWQSAASNVTYWQRTCA